MRIAAIALTLVSAIGAAVCAGPDGVTTDPDSRRADDSKLTIRPARDTAGVGDTVRFELVDPDSSPSVRWTVSQSAIAQILEQHGTRVSIVARSVGTTSVTAERDGASGEATLVVLDSYSPDTTVAAVRFSAKVADTVSVRDSAAFGINVYDSELNALFGRPVTWTLSDSSIARITVGYHPHIVWLHALTNGVVTLTATVDGQSDCARLIVGDSIPSGAPRCPMRPIASFRFAHPSITAYLDAWLTSGVWIEDAQGFLLLDRTVTWSVGDSTILKLWTPVSSSAPGTAQVTLTGLRAGTTTITGTSEGWTAVQTVTLIPQR
jgi:plastocyanin